MLGCNAAVVQHRAPMIVAIGKACWLPPALLLPAVLHLLLPLVISDRCQMVAWSASCFPTGTCNRANLHRICLPHNVAQVQPAHSLCSCRSEQLRFSYAAGMCSCGVSCLTGRLVCGITSGTLHTAPHTGAALLRQQVQRVCYKSALHSASVIVRCVQLAGEGFISLALARQC
jgi:hypothetical protein